MLLVILVGASIYLLRNWRGDYAEGEVLGEGLEVTAREPIEELAEAARANALVERMVEALGGSRVLAQLQSLRASGSLVIEEGSDPMPITLIKKEGDYLSLIIDFPGGQVHVKHGDKRAWREEWSGGELLKATALPARDQRILGRSSMLRSEISLLRERGWVPHYEGVAEWEGAQCYVLRLEGLPGEQLTLYVDRENYLEQGRVQVLDVEGESVEIRSYFSDFREVGGMQFPHRTQTAINGAVQVITIDKVRVNVGVLGGYWEYPEALLANE